VFLLVWLASQHINSAILFGSSMAGVMAEASDMALGLYQMPGDTSIGIDAALVWASRACHLNATMVASWVGERLNHWAKTSEFHRHERKKIQQVGQMIGKGDCLQIGRDFTTSLKPEDLWHSIPNPQASAGKCPADSHADTDCIPPLHFTHHDLWPSRVSTVHIDLPSTFHERLSQFAIKRYLAHQKQSKRQHPYITQEAINNGFFNIQQNAEHHWPEMLENPDFRHIKRVLTKAAVEYAKRIGRWPEGHDVDELQDVDLFIWTAVYTEGTPHLTHCHDQGIVSGAYYSLAPTGSAPIVFTDPRGGQPMHIDSAGHAPETEPEAPFHQNGVFFPKMGDLVLFPSWLPHRVPPSKSNQTRVVWSFNLNGPVNSWSRTTFP